MDKLPSETLHPTSDSASTVPYFVNTASVASTPNSDSNSFIFHTENNMIQPTPRERTLWEMAALDFTYESLCIQYPNEEVPYVLKTGLIHMLPKFHGLAGECPHKHMKEFHIVCSTMKPHDVPKDHIFLKAFPHSLENAAKDWLYCLGPRSITSWDDLKRLFLEKFFPASRTTAIRKDISGIRQLGGESLYEYWERFKKLCASCPHHQIPENLLLQYFYEGLNNMDRSMIDAANGGALGDMTPVEARHLIEKMASNSQQFSTRSDAIVVMGVHDIATQSSSSSDRKLETKLDSLHPIAHDTPQAYATNIYNNRQPQQQNYDLSNNRYVPPPVQRFQRQQQEIPAQPAFQPSTSSFELTLEELLNQAQSQNSDRLSSQTVQNPRNENVSEITLRSGKQIFMPIVPPPAPTFAASQRKEDQAGPTRTFEAGGPSSSFGGCSSSGEPSSSSFVT
ncbi:uncharacterized protein LOC108332737 [Vigna angularis]|uniref:uncharacterized protein LOC108332737 n=1 Tax=Phaseolus angularis TaxID=3914 RepID=UPI0022B52F66|nr:uncharacterized protein LOC108332737 [Vigna angularis]